MTCTLLLDFPKHTLSGWLKTRSNRNNGSNVNNKKTLDIVYVCSSQTHLFDQDANSHGDGAMIRQEDEL